MSIKLSMNNSKLGKIMNYSTVPVQDCPNCDGCKADCYALKAYKQYPSVRVAWMNNSDIQRDHEDVLVTSVVQQIKAKRKAPKLFRIHVAGDYTDQKKVDAWVEIANQCKGTQFLSFTKSSHLDFSAAPKNMVIIHSQWEGQPKINHTGINAWIEGDERIPDKHMVCKGSASQGGLKCDECKYCFQSNVKLDVVFSKH